MNDSQGIYLLFNANGNILLKKILDLIRPERVQIQFAVYRNFDGFQNYLVLYIFFRFINTDDQVTRLLKMDHNNLIRLIGLLVFAYLLGSIPFGLILVKIFKSMDVRQIGSGNIGATNVRRAGGWSLGIATLFCDALKGAVPVYIAGFLFGEDMVFRNFGVCFAALASISGHLFPVYLKFKTGGKGVATAAGSFAIISPPALVIALLVFVCAVALSKRVSMGSLSAAVVLPLAVIWAERSMMLAGFALVISLLVVFRHHENIRRLIAGTEPPLWGK